MGMAVRLSPDYPQTLFITSHWEHQHGQMYKAGRRTWEVGLSADFPVDKKCFHAGTSKTFRNLTFFELQEACYKAFPAGSRLVVKP